MQGNFARYKLTLDAIRYIQADFYELPDETRKDTSPNSSNQKIKGLEVVKLDAFVTSQQTILPILNSEGMGHQCLDQKAQLMSDTKEQLPDWVTGLEGETVTCEDDYQIEHQTSHSGVFNRDMR